MVSKTIDTRKSIAASLIHFFSLNNTSGAKTKASKYQLFANKNFIETSGSVEKIAATTIQQKWRINIVITGCFQIEFSKTDGLYIQFAKNNPAVTSISGSSGRSVPSVGVKFHS